MAYACICHFFFVILQPIFLCMYMRMRIKRGIIKGIWMSLLLLASVRLCAVGWTPTDGGLVVNLKPQDKILISTVVNGKEYFINNYTRYTGGDWGYKAGHYLKLIPQAAGATEPSEMSVWTVDTALTRVCTSTISGLTKGTDYALGGISYTIWNDDKTLRSEKNSKDLFKFLGDLGDDIRNDSLCDVVFVIPTDHEGVTSFDPNRTLGRGGESGAAKGRFNGATGTGFLDMTYREVYMMVIPRFNSPVSYTNAALVTFNTTDKQKTWSNGQIKCDPGRAAYAYADDKHKPTPRTIFRLYILNEPINSCSNYFFAYDDQDYVRYRKSNNLTEFTGYKKIYTMDRLSCMEQEGETTTWLTGDMQVPASDSSYFYVGRNNHYYNQGDSAKYQLNPDNNAVVSMFTKIRELPMLHLADKKAPAKAYGQMVVSTGSTERNLGVAFEPAGYMLRTSSKKNVRMVQTGDYEWTTQDMWTINEGWDTLTIRATLMTGPEFREDDPGADVDAKTKA